MRRALQSKRYRFGFTLAEVLIVVFIVALVSGVLLLRAASVSPVRVTQRVAKQLRSYLVVAQEQAILQPAVLGLTLAQEGYQILQLTDVQSGDWAPIQQDRRFWQAHPISRDVVLQLTRDNQSFDIPIQLSSIHSPQITLLPSGEITPFELLVQHRSAGTAYKITGNFAGQIDLVEVP